MYKNFLAIASLVAAGQLFLSPVAAATTYTVRTVGGDGSVSISVEHNTSSGIDVSVSWDSFNFNLDFPSHIVESGSEFMLSLILTQDLRANSVGDLAILTGDVYGSLFLFSPISLAASDDDSVSYNLPAAALGSFPHYVSSSASFELVKQVSPIPMPASPVLLAIGLTVVGLVRRRKLQTITSDLT